MDADPKHTIVPSDASITFSVKELIGRVDSKLDLLIAKVDEKASRDLVDRLAAQLQDKADTRFALELENRIGVLETEGATSRAVGTSTRWILFTAIPAVAAVTAVVTTLL